MAETGINVTPGSGQTVATDQVAALQYQQIKIVDGTIGSSTPAGVTSIGLKVDTTGNPASSVSGTVGSSIIGTVPVTQAGAFFISGSIATVGGSSAANQSVSGTIGASIIGLVPVAIISGGTGGGSVSGTVGASIIGLPPVNVVGTPSISGTVNIGSVTGGSIPITISSLAVAGGLLNVAVQQTVNSGVSVIGAVPVTLYTTPGSIVSGVTSVITGTASVLVLAAPTGVQRNYVTQILVTNGSSTSTFVDIVDNGQIIYSGLAAASGGGFSASFPVPLRQPTSALGLYVLTPTQASVVVSASGYIAP